MLSSGEVSKKLHNTFFTLTLFTGVLFLINCYMYVFRYHHGYMYTEAFNYNELYFPDENYRIQNLESLPEDSLRIIILPTSSSFDWVINDSVNRYTEKASKHPTIKLRNGKHLYKIKASGSQGLDSLVMEIEYHRSDGGIFVSSCNLPMIEHPLYPIANWTKLSKNITTEEISEVKKILKDTIGVSDTGSTIERIALIGKYLIGKLGPLAGHTPDSIKQLSPLRQYMLACAKKGHVDCESYCQIYFLFANCAGIPTRKIGVSGKLSNAVIAGHVFDESYIKEQRRWAFVDLTYKNIIVFAGGGKVLNTIDLLNINSSANYDNIRVLSIDSLSRIDTVPYFLVKNSESEIFISAAKLYWPHPDINNNMSFIESFEEYLGERSHYGIYYNGTFKIDNGRHYLKLFAFLVFAVSFTLWISLVILRMFNFSKNRKSKN